MPLRQKLIYTLLSLMIIMGLLIYHRITPPVCTSVSEQPSDYSRLNHINYVLDTAIDNQQVEVIRDIVLYFVQSKDMDADGLIGYGLATEFDAFSDGSVNPVNHEYTVTNGVITLQLARALQLDIWSADEYDAIRSTIYQVVQAVNDTAWHESGYYRYSHAPTDIDHVLNVNAIWIGTQQYILANTDIGTQAERQLWQDRNTQGIMNLLYIMPRNPLTVYRTGHPILNDLDHQAAQLRYLEIYRDNGGWLPYGAQDAIDSLYAYQHGESWYIHPDYQRCLLNRWHVEYTLQILAK